MEPAIEMEPLSEFEQDALREVATVGAGHAATALSQLTGMKVLINVPYINIVHIAKLPKLIGDQEALMAGTYMRIFGDGAGALLLVLERTAAIRLVDLMMQSPTDRRGLLSEMERSALREAGNILAGAFLSAVSNFLDVVLLPSVPSLAFDMAGALLQWLVVASGVDRDYAFVMHIRFHGENQQLGGHFVMVPDTQTMNVLLDGIKELSKRDREG